MKSTERLIPAKHHAKSFIYKDLINSSKKPYIEGSIMMTILNKEKLSLGKHR